MSAADTPAPLEFFQLVTRYQIPQAIYVAAKLGIANLLADGPKSIEELARATGANPQSLKLLMYALSSVNVFAEDAQGRFELTPLASYLRSDMPHSQRAWALSQAETGYPTWAQLLHTITTGRPAFPRIFGVSYYEYMAQHPEIAADWDQSMDQTAQSWLHSLTTIYDFTRLRTVVDVGGGHGGLLASILKDVPDLRGILFDLPHVVAGAGPLLAEAGVAGRCEIVGGDMFAGVPGGGDIYIIARVLLNWDDERALAILKSCRRAMGEQARLLVVDIVDADADKPRSAAFGDLNLLLLMGGRQRTEAEFHSLFGSAGFSIAQITPTHSHFKMIEGVPT
jgi:hypothetical protein